MQQWCTRVIDIADDWNAIEQAHLRLALAEQKRAGADGGRRAFQVTYMSTTVKSGGEHPPHPLKRIFVCMDNEGNQ